MGEDQRRAGTQVDFSAWEAQSNRLNPKYGSVLLESGSVIRNKNVFTVAFTFLADVRGVALSSAV